MVKHGHTTSARHRSTTYVSWAAMKQRCRDSNCARYKYYGGRGIRVCSRWLGDTGFENFLSDMGEQPMGMTLDRKDINGDYSLSNCKWSTSKEQARNRRNGVYMTSGGITKLLIEWSEELGIAYHTLWGRKRMGWSDEKSLTTPLDIARYPRNRMTG